MDPRQPQHPFSRNTASPYGRNSFPAGTNPTQYPPSSHPPNAAPSYAEHQRRPSDPPPYSSYSQRQYAGEGPPMSGGGHSRHQSSNSIGHGPSGRGMPPPSSPQQRAQHGYGQAVNPGPPGSFASGRELPALPAGRPASTAGGSMSIHSILGGPPPASREQQPSHYASPVTTAAPQTSIFSRPNHGSPHTTAAPDYAPFRRPLTPEQRSYEPRDHRANSAGSPLGGTHYTPDARRFGTPQGYGQRMQVEERREPIRVPNPNVDIPPRPSSQPQGYSAPSRLAEARRHEQSAGIFGRREPVRTDPPSRERPYHAGTLGTADSAIADYENSSAAFRYAERQRALEAEKERVREVALQREREQRERAERSHMMQQEYAHQLAQSNAQAYSRTAEREIPAWLRAGAGAYEPPRAAYEPIPEQAPHQREPLPGHDYPRTTAPQYPTHPAYAANEHRYAAASQPAQAPAQHSSIPPSQYEAALQLSQRVQEEEHRRRAMYGQSQAPYQSQESPTRRPPEDPQQQLHHQAQRSFLGVQEINRKGRISPLPQAVQGAQGQIGGPNREPSIKNEFQRMFSGLGSGVGPRGISSPVTGGPQSLPNSAQSRRDDLEGLQGQDSPVEIGGFKLARSPSRGGRRRKLKDEDGKDDDSSTGRRTPSGNGRGKRPKTNHYSHNQHLQHRDDITSSPLQSHLTPFKNVKGLPIPSPPETKPAPVPHHHHVPRHHHHHHHVTPARPVAQSVVIVPAPKRTITSVAVLDAVANKPRKHLGHMDYEVTLEPAGESVDRPPTKLGFKSTSKELPRFTEMDDNSTFTIRVSRVHLTPTSREEITHRRGVWGTDIYTDDSDVIAACIHQGWFRGEWPANIDSTLLGLELDDEPPDSPKDFFEAPPRRGPIPVPADRDADITVLILPLLEKYSSCTRFGLKSREWGGEHHGYKGRHDGRSFKIQSVRFISSVSNAPRRSTRKIMPARAASEEIIEVENVWTELFDGNLLRKDARDGNDPPIEESFERGGGRDPLPLDGIKDIGTKSWWKPAPAGSKVKAPVVVEVSAAPSSVVPPGVEAEIEAVAERMIENANINADTGAGAQAAHVDVDVQIRDGVVTLKTVDGSGDAGGST